MSKVFTIVKCLSVVALFSACAYEKDPGFKPKQANANTAVSDKLKGLPSADVLKAKYKTLSAECTLAVSEKVASVVAAEENNPPAPPAEPSRPVTNEGPKTKVDFKAQAAVDPKLEKNLEGLMEVADVDRKLNLSVNLKPLAFNPENLTLKVDAIVYVMKYSPVLSGSWTYTETLGNGDATSTSGELKAINEQVPFKQVVRTEKKGDKTYEHVLSCLLKGDIDDKNADVQGQLLKVDCSGAIPSEAQLKVIYEANCKPKMEPPANPDK